MMQIMQQSAEESQQQIQQIREQEQPWLPFDRALWARKGHERDHERFDWALYRVKEELKKRRGRSVV